MSDSKIAPSPSIPMVLNDTGGDQCIRCKRYRGDGFNFKAPPPPPQAPKGARVFVSMVCGNREECREAALAYEAEQAAQAQAQAKASRRSRG